MSTYQRVGEFLVAKGLLTNEQVQLALEAKRQTTRRFGEVVVALGFASEDDIVHCLAEQYQMEVLDPLGLRPQPAALRLVPSSQALERLILPYKLTDFECSCILADPLDVAITDELSASVKRPLRLTLGAPSRLREAIIQAYKLPLTPPAPSKRKRKPVYDMQTDRQALLEALAARAGVRTW